MNFISFSLIVIGVLLNAAAQLMLKAGTNALGVLIEAGNNIFVSLFRIVFEPHIFAGLSCYVLSVGVWIIALSRVDVSIAYPMLSIGYVVNAVAAWYLFGEPISVLRVTGIFVIIVGVCLVAKS